ncbi:MAG: hypothetical protein COU06_00050 [Candidatus Harrisonbacteria bacterium CG10_big_fil_rev_8_21_14_0_10_38_8]|uniref:Uncharacterized protein n=1 Tax=Candidatus Harrisonbacteria bacterium CG10_big_fil_rev_8_21_14_0_10_38_8 TaxID=1974582 RepID=A0A2M6WKT6_9BACT|nr:MAG: hypothetical protein COU06_00050 [Candidatus Harrisonbacteria bacterium CG10_big_fil_rev_8_21_14_0_10_38_8]
MYKITTNHLISNDILDFLDVYLPTEFDPEKTDNIEEDFDYITTVLGLKIQELKSVYYPLSTEQKRLFINSLKTIIKMHTYLRSQE